MSLVFISKPETLPLAGKLSVDLQSHGTGGDVGAAASILGLFWNIWHCHGD